MSLSWCQPKRRGPEPDYTKVAWAKKTSWADSTRLGDKLKIQGWLGLEIIRDIRAELGSGLEGSGIYNLRLARARKEVDISILTQLDPLRPKCLILATIIENVGPFFTHFNQF